MRLKIILNSVSFLTIQPGFATDPKVCELAHLKKMGIMGNLGIMRIMGIVRESFHPRGVGESDFFIV